MEGLIESVANLRVYVHPSQTKNVDEAILCELSSLLFKLSMELYWLIVSSLKINVREFSLGYTLIWCQTTSKHADLLAEAEHAFSEPIIEGKVVKLTRESIHCIVLGFSSAIVTDENIRNELKYKSKHGKRVYVSRYHKRHVIKGDMSNSLLHAPLLLNCVDSEIIHISGSLIPANTGSVHWLDKYYVDTGTDSNKETRRQTKEDVEMQEQVTVGGETMPLVNNNHKIKKSKKRRRAEDQ